MTLFTWRIFLGLLGSILISVFGVFAKLLTKSGGLTVIFIGTTVFIFGTFSEYSLFFFLFGSSALIQFFKQNISKQLDTITEKQHARDAFQVLANGLIPCILLVLSYFTHLQLFLVAYVATIAGATADTWASEIGTLSKKTPRSLLNGKQVPPGLSGGVSLLGTLSSLIGSMFIAILFILLSGDSIFNSLSFFIIILLSGFFASIIDSFLGATIQAAYLNNENKITEKPTEGQTKNFLFKGYSWVTNDTVNFFTSILTVVVSWIFMYFLY